MRGSAAIKFESRDNEVRRLQRAALHIFWDNGPGYVMSVEKALQFDQRTFPTLRSRDYIEYLPGRRGFRMTRRGWALREYWDNTNPFRKTAAHQFGASLRAIQGLEGTFDFDEEKSNVRELKRAV